MFTTTTTTTNYAHIMFTTSSDEIIRGHEALWPSCALRGLLQCGAWRKRLSSPPARSSACCRCSPRIVALSRQPVSLACHSVERPSCSMLLHGFLPLVLLLFRQAVMRLLRRSVGLADSARPAGLCSKLVLVLKLSGRNACMPSSCRSSLSLASTRGSAHSSRVRRRRPTQRCLQHRRPARSAPPQRIPRPSPVPHPPLSGARAGPLAPRRLPRRGRRRGGGRGIASRLSTARVRRPTHRRATVMVVRPPRAITAENARVGSRSRSRSRSRSPRLGSGESSGDDVSGNSGDG